MGMLSQTVFAVIIGSIIFVGLPILGWGIADVQGFIAHPARVGYIVICILLQIVVAVYFPGAGRSGNKGEKLIRRQQVAVFLLQVFSLAMVLVSPFTDARSIASIDAWDLIRYFGLGVFAGGFLLMNWSAAILGKQFSVQVTIQAQHQLVMSGPYKRIRHPRYLGIILFNLGIGLVFRSWLGILLTALIALTLLWRIHDEEELMHQTFEADWKTYANQSWRLVPFLW